MTTPERPERWTQYRRTQIAEMTDWEPGFDMTDVAVSEADRKNGSPKQGDKIAHNPANHADHWLIAADYFAANFEPLNAPSHPAPLPAEVAGLLDEARVVLGAKTDLSLVLGIEVRDLIRDLTAYVRGAAAELDKTRLALLNEEEAHEQTQDAAAEREAEQKDKWLAEWLAGWKQSDDYLAREVAEARDALASAAEREARRREALTDAIEEAHGYGLLRDHADPVAASWDGKYARWQDCDAPVCAAARAALSSEPSQEEEGHS